MAWPCSPCSPPGIPRERFVLELLEIRESGRRPTPEEWEEFYRRHDQYMV